MTFRIVPNYRRSPEREMTRYRKAASRLYRRRKHGVLMLSDASDVRHLIQLFCLEAGRIMEDESVYLALALPGAPLEVKARLAATKQAGEDIAALAAAAGVLWRRAEMSEA